MNRGLLLNLSLVLLVKAYQRCLSQDVALHGLLNVLLGCRRAKAQNGVEGVKLERVAIDGTPLIESSGLTLMPLQVNFGGISPLFENEVLPSFIKITSVLLRLFCWPCEQAATKIAKNATDRGLTFIKLLTADENLNLTLSRRISAKYKKRAAIMRL